MSHKSSDPFAPRRPPTQRRAKILVESVREAAKKILEEDGPEGLTTNRVAERAGVSVGSLYHYYPNKESIVVDLFEERVAKIVSDIAEEAGDSRLTDLSIEDSFRLHIRLILRHRRELAGLHREFLERWGTRFEVPRRTAPDGRTYWEVTRDSMATLIEQNRDRTTVESPDAAAELIMLITDGFARAVSEERLPELSDDELIASMTRAMLACIGYRTDVETNVG